MTDPWLTQQNSAKSIVNGINSSNGEDVKEFERFEDNFAPNTEEKNDNNTAAITNNVRNQTNKEHKPLPDSASYLRGLEQKLEKIKKGTKLVEALAEKRQDCLRALLNEQIDDGVYNNNETLVALDTPINNVDSTVQGLYNASIRHLQPVQAVTVGEIVHIVKYDQLQEEQQQEPTNEGAEDENDIVPEK